MRFRLLHAGSPGRGPLESAASDYRERLRRHPSVGVDETFVKAVSLRRESPAEIAQALSTEASRLLAKLNRGEFLVALDRAGKTRSSTQLAADVQRWQERGHRDITFVLGSSHGLAQSVLERAQVSWSFGPLTLPHDLARVVLWEQLFRARSIIDRTPYHK